MKKTMFMLFAAGVLFACNRSGQEPEPQKETPNTTPKDEYICSNHHVNRYIKIDTVSIAEEALKVQPDGTYEMTILFATKEYYGFRRPEAAKEDFQACVKKFGDTGSKMTFPDPLDYGAAISAYIRSIDVFSEDDYDQAHPSRTSLADIAQIGYHTIYPLIQNGYKVDGLDGLVLPDVDETDPRYGVQRINKKIAALTEAERAMVYFEPEIGITSSKRQYQLYKIVLTQKPVKEVQSLCFKITTDEGVFSTRKRIAFL